MAGIVVGVDGSPHSRVALRWAVEESVLRRAALTVVAVNPIAVGLYGIAPQYYPADEQSRDEVEQATRALVDEVLAERGEQEAPQVAVRVVSGLPADELIKASQEADLLVVGARGAGGFARLMVGSVSSQVSHHARCPVVIVPGEQPR